MKKIVKEVVKKNINYFDGPPTETQKPKLSKIKKRLFFFTVTPSLPPFELRFLLLPSFVFSSMKRSSAAVANDDDKNNKKSKRDVSSKPPRLPLFLIVRNPREGVPHIKVHQCWPTIKINSESQFQVSRDSKKQILLMEFISGESEGVPCSFSFLFYRFLIFDRQTKLWVSATWLNTVFSVEPTVNDDPFTNLGFGSGPVKLDGEVWSSLSGKRLLQLPWQPSERAKFLYGDDGRPIVQETPFSYLPGSIYPFSIVVVYRAIVYFGVSFFLYRHNTKRETVWNTARIRRR